MLEKMMSNGVLFYAIGIVTMLGVIAKFISCITTNNLVQAAGDIQKSNQKLMRLVKAKFEHASMVSDKVQNVEAFVRKYLYEYKVLGMRLSSWRDFPLKMAWTVGVIGILGMMAGYQIYGMGEATLQYGMAGVVGAVILLSFHLLIPEKMKLEAAKNYMVEYLENVCVHRYEKAKRSLAEVMEEKKEPTETHVEAKAEPETEEKTEILEEEHVKMEKDEQEMRIRAILQEFLA